MHLWKVPNNLIRFIPCTFKTNWVTIAKRRLKPVHLKNLIATFQYFTATTPTPGAPKPMAGRTMSALSKTSIDKIVHQRSVEIRDTPEVATIDSTKSSAAMRAARQLSLKRQPSKSALKPTSPASPKDPPQEAKPSAPQKQTTIDMPKDDQGPKSAAPMPPSKQDPAITKQPSTKQPPPKPEKITTTSTKPPDDLPSTQARGKSKATGQVMGGWL